MGYVVSVIDADGMIVDAHTDVLLELLVREGEEPSFELLLRRGEAGVFKRYWLPRLIAGGVGVQICPLYGEGARRVNARERTLAQEAEFRSVVEENAERVCQVRSSTLRTHPSRPGTTSSKKGFPSR
jgi:microsomal dipeptidase-like Zn-dependent dipeptidase